MSVSINILQNEVAALNQKINGLGIDGTCENGNVNVWLTGI
jgi:hypothetical protein